MIRTIFLALCVFLVGCSVNESEIYGTYRYEKRGFVQQLLIKPDGTFEQSLRLKKTMTEDMIVEGTYDISGRDPSGFFSIRFEEYMNATRMWPDGDGRIFYEDIERWERGGGFVTTPEKVFGTVRIGFYEYEYYKKVKDWEEGDTLRKSVHKPTDSK